MTAYYQSNLIDFFAKTDETILGILTKAATGDNFPQIETNQTWAWIKEIDILKKVLKAYSILEPGAGILLEFPIPRRGKRVDAVLLLRGIIFVVEFKIAAALKGDDHPNKAFTRQCEDYALDLRDFHRESKGRTIIPIVLDTAISSIIAENFNSDIDYVKKVRVANNIDSFRAILTKSIENYRADANIELEKWSKSVYQPTPTIIEAAQRLYANHSITDITRSGADSYNLTKTTKAVLNIIEFARQNNRKAIVFVSGVPGSGKTLVGLNVAHDAIIKSQGYNVSFLSGNYPLVTVLQEALARDQAIRERKSKKKCIRESSTKIQLVLNFKEYYYKEDKQTPDEHIIIFDEAQRAWTLEYMIKKSRGKSKPYTISEPDLIMEIMNRHSDWCIIICLIGNGQEIHNGEAGVQEWASTILKKYHDWLVFSSSELTGINELKASETKDERSGRKLLKINANLHLSTSIRSFKASKLSEWVDLVLNDNPETAKKVIPEMSDYPIVITRELQNAKQWVSSQCRGLRSCGLICSSGGKRLRPESIETEIEIDVAQWFLSDRTDIRSSSFMELPATEFKIQGLELDWVCLAWDINLIRNRNSWNCRKFSGTKWENLNNKTKRDYLVNSYRVLMTRGREGMAIFVPKGSGSDSTRPPELYDGIYNYLVACGVTELP